MATSPKFSIAPSQTAEVPDSATKGHPILPVVITVPVVSAILVVVSIIWYCWFRKRRPQHRAHSRTPPPRRQRRSFVLFERDKKTFNGRICKAKPDMEERSGDSDPEDRDSMHVRSPAGRKSTMQLPRPPPPPPPAPVERRAELPIFITPRSSRHVHPAGHLRTPTELDINPRSPWPKSVDVEQGAEVNEPALPIARQSKRLSLKQLLRIRKVSELEGHTKLPSISQDQPAKQQDAMKDGGPDTQSCHPAFRSKRFSLHDLLYLRRFAELAVNTMVPAQVSNMHPGHDEELSHPSSRRSHRLSLHRLLRSKRQAELEASTDTLPKYSPTESNPKSQFISPALPLKDMDFKHPLPRRGMTPVELEATEPNRLLSPSYELAGSYEGQRQNSVCLAGSPSSHSVPEDQQALECSVPESNTGSEEVTITLMEPPTIPDAVELLIPPSTCSEGAYDEDIERVPENVATAQSSFAYPLGSTPGDEERMDPFLTAEIISAAIEPSTRSPVVQETQHIQKIDHGKRIPRKVSAIHEMDATESAMKRRSKGESSHPSNFRHEAHRRRPDFVTFKKQMTEAERRAKMIAKRRRSRRRLTPKSF